MGFAELVVITARIAEAAGIGVMLVGMLIAFVRILPGLRKAGESTYHQFRQHLGRAILLGLEFLVAADIIRTVSEIPTLERVVVLAVIVFIRTFLSVALEVELEGRWPWQPRAGTQERGR